MRTYQKYTLTVFAALSVGYCLSCCDSFVEVELPNNQLTGEAVFVNVTTANAAVVNIYARMRDRGMLSGNTAGLSMTLGNYADELDFYGAVTSPNFFFNSNSLVAANSTVSDYWVNAYNQIYQANAVLEGVTASNTIAPEVKDRLRGEAFFLRALLHFYLTNLYGEIPYVETTSYTANSVVSKLSPEVVYSFITDDLENAITLLPEAYFTAGRARANRYAAFALLARVYLYNGQWAEAADAASAVINQSTLYGSNGNIQDVFLKNSSETILQLPPALSGSQTELGATFTVLTAPPPNSALRSDFISGFESGDLRRQYWIGEITGAGTTYYFPKKYRQYTAASESSESSILLRLPEMYLIRAEARARQGQLTDAKEDLDVVRLRAGLAPVTAVTQEGILAAIYNERRMELFTEYGHRFLDLKRWGLTESVLTGVKPGWNAEDKLLPLPQSELTLNPNLLPQNLGY